MTVIVCEDLLGKTFDSVQKIYDELQFIGTEQVTIYPKQDHYESITINNITGDLKDLVGEPLLEAEFDVETGVERGLVANYPYTFITYKFTTKKGIVTVRWYIY